MHRCNSFQVLPEFHAKHQNRSESFKIRKREKYIEVNKRRRKKKSSKKDN